VTEATDRRPNGRHWTLRTPLLCENLDRLSKIWLCLLDARAPARAGLFPVCSRGRDRGRRPAPTSAQ
jgi:hypothetical protein